MLLENYLSSSVNARKGCDHFYDICKDVFIIKRTENLCRRKMIVLLSSIIFVTCTISAVYKTFVMLLYSSTSLIFVSIKMFSGKNAWVQNVFIIINRHIRDLGL